VASRIAWSDGKAAPAALVAAAESALARDDPVSALRLAQRARDRNDDFVSALPGMTGRVPLREVVYHPKLYDVIVTAIDHCASERLLPPSEVAAVAREEWKCLDNDWPRSFAEGDQGFWGHFLSDCMYLYATAFPSSIESSAMGNGKPDREVVTYILEHVRLLPEGRLTRRGIQARGRLCTSIGMAAPPSTDRFQALPTTFDHLPCRDLITQEEIRTWLTQDREPTGGPGGATADLPTYVTSRPRYPRPPTTDLVELKNMALWDGVSQTVTRVDAWWIAMDLALYRWEMLQRFDKDTTEWARQIAYDLYAAKRRGDAPDSPLWAWTNLIDLFRYCYERTVALVPTVSVDRPNDQREAQGARNFFAWALLEVLGAAGDTTGWNAFAPEVHAILCASHPQTRTASQTGLLRALESRYGPCDREA
jgi:hypothetical protein